MEQRDCYRFGLLLELDYCGIERTLRHRDRHLHAKEEEGNEVALGRNHLLQWVSLLLPRYESLFDILLLRSFAASNDASRFH